MPKVTESKYLVMAGWDDVPHLDEKTKRELLDATPAHERQARSRGIPVLGSGKIFTMDEDLIKEDAIQIPAHWKRICGIDFGWDHPTALSWIAWDVDADVIHVYDVYKESEAVPMIHTGVWRSKGSWIPVAWPHDGFQHDKGSGESLKNQYMKHGMKMLANQATHAPSQAEPEGSGGNSVEAGLLEMFERMRTGRLKVARHLEAFFEEYRLYHRKDGKIVKQFDDIISATRYAIMMKRFAVTDVRENKVIITQHQPLDAEMGY